MKAFFDLQIKPTYEHLNKLLQIYQDEDEVVIPVKVTFKDGTTQVFEDGILMECDHAGNTLSEVTAPYWNSDAHIFEPTGSAEAYICDHCPAWSDDGSNWYE